MKFVSQTCDFRSGVDLFSGDLKRAHEIAAARASKTIREAKEIGKNYSDPQTQIYIQGHLLPATTGPRPESVFLAGPSTKVHALEGR